MTQMTSSDFANASANDANRKADDQAVLIQWLMKRVSVLEKLLEVDMAELALLRPELPSERTQRLWREGMANLGSQVEADMGPYVKKLLGK